MPHRERGRVPGPHPQPLPCAAAEPGRCIHRVDRRVARLRGKRRGVRRQRLGHAVAYCVDGSQADGPRPGPRHTQSGPSAARCRRSRRLPPPQRTAPWAIPCRRLTRHPGLHPATTGRAPALVQHPGRHVHGARRPFTHLRRVVRPAQGPQGVSPRTPLGSHRTDGRGGHELLAMARMAWLPARLPGHGAGGGWRGGLSGPSDAGGRVDVVESWGSRDSRASRRFSHARRRVWTLGGVCCQAAAGLPMPLAWALGHWAEAPPRLLIQ